MKYKNKTSGTIVEPVGELAEQSFKLSGNWLPYKGGAGAANSGAGGAGDGEKPLDKMTVAELEAKAAELGVDISQATNNAGRVELLEAATKKD